MNNKKEIKRIKTILKTLPEIRRAIKRYSIETYVPYAVNNGRRVWERIKVLCEPLGLSDTAFRDYPTLDDFLVSYSYWRKRLKEIEKANP
jgi:hypothetical protein